MTDRPRSAAVLRARLELPRSRRAAGLLDGRHRSILQGHGQDFDDLSLYTPGDDVGDIDWKSSARAGIPVIRRFVRETDLTVVLAVDTGRAMAALAPSGETKADVVLHAATLVGRLAGDRGDRVALVAADAGRARRIPARGGVGHLEVLLRQIERSLTLDAPESDVPRLLDRVTSGFPRRALVVLLTDTAHPGPDDAAALRSARIRHDVLVMSVADADPLAAAPDVTRDVSDGWAVPTWLPGRRRLQRAVARAREDQAEARAATLRRLDVHDVVVGGTADVVPGLIALAGRSRRARR